MKAKELVKRSVQVLSGKDKNYPLVTFRRHKHTGKIHLFSSEKREDGCYGYKESYCSRETENPVKLKDTESLRSMKLTTPFEESFSVSSFKCMKKDVARFVAALLQNNGYDVCGVCVSHLYSGEEKSK